MKIKIQLFNLWKDLSERFDIISFEYDYIMNYNVRKGIYIGVIIFNFELLIYFLKKENNG